MYQDYNAPPAADVDAFAAVLKGDIGGAAGSSAAAAYGMPRSGNGTSQPLPPQSPPATAVSGYNLSLLGRNLKGLV